MLAKAKSSYNRSEEFIFSLSLSLSLSHSFLVVIRSVDERVVELCRRAGRPLEKDDATPDRWNTVKVSSATGSKIELFAGSITGRWTWEAHRIAASLLW